MSAEVAEILSDVNNDKLQNIENVVRYVTKTIISVVGWPVPFYTDCEPTVTIYPQDVLGPHLRLSGPGFSWQQLSHCASAYG